MSLRHVVPGRDIPNEINVIIEIPMESEPVKYEVDKDSGTLFVDRFLSTSMRYPCNYGYIPLTLSEDNDPVDVLVLCPFPVIGGSVVRCRPIAMLKMEDEKGPDTKLLAVPIAELTPLYAHVNKPSDISPNVLAEIKHFFEHYKDLEPKKWVKVDGWSGPNAAKKEILQSVKRYQKYLENK